VGERNAAAASTAVSDRTKVRIRISFGEGAPQPGRVA